MPTIIKRFAELGTVIESQKRHMDRWKANEINLALSEQRANLAMINTLGEVWFYSSLRVFFKSKTYYTSLSI